MAKKLAPFFRSSSMVDGKNTNRLSPSKVTDVQIAIRETRLPTRYFNPSVAIPPSFIMKVWATGMIGGRKSRLDCAADSLRGQVLTVVTSMAGGEDGTIVSQHAGTCTCRRSAACPWVYTKALACRRSHPPANI